MGWTNRYRFQVEDNDGNTRDVTPKNSDLLITGDRQNSRFNWSYLIGDPVIFDGDDFAWLWDLENDNRPPAERCGGVAFRIYESCGGAETLKYQYFINLNEAEFAPDICTARCKLQPVDYFSCVYRSWEDEVDVLDEVATKHTVPGLVGYLETQTCGPISYPSISHNDVPTIEDGCLSDPADGWVILQNYWLTTGFVSTVPPGTYIGEAATVWVRERVDDSATQPPGDGWISIGGDSWVRSPEVYYYQDGPYYYNLPPYNTYIKYWVKLGKVVGASPSVVVDELDEYSFELSPPTNPIPTQSVEYSNGLLLEDVLEALLDNGSCTFTLKSNFFRINPDDPFPAAEPYPTAASGFEKVMVWQLSDIVRYNASEDATDLKLSLKDLLEDLRNVYNVDWTIEDNGATFRIEHISYFVNANGEDLTLSPWDPYTAKRNGYNYDSVKIPKVENFQFAFKTTPFFNGSPIVYVWNCASSDLKDATFAARFTSTDLGYFHQVGEEAPLTGIFLGAMIEGGGFGAYSYYFAREDDDTGAPRTNGHFAFTKLLPNYWKWDRPQTSGQINGVTTSFETTFRVKRQQPITLPVGCDFLGSWDPNDLLKTGIGWGEVDAFEISLANCALTVILLHEPNV